MNERNFNLIFSEKLRYFLDKYEMTQVDLAKRLGVGTTSIYNWLNAIKTPRMDKVDAMCEIFHCKRSDFFADENAETPPTVKSTLTPHEGRVIEKYRRLDEDNKVVVEKTMDAMLSTQKEGLSDVREIS